MHLGERDRLLLVMFASFFAFSFFAFHLINGENRGNWDAGDFLQLIVMSGLFCIALVVRIWNLRE